MEVQREMPDIEAELRAFESLERERLGIKEEAAQWFDAVPQTFTRAQREHTTLLVSGLTMAHDLFVRRALSGVGYKVVNLDCPDTDALRFGKEFGNRGQCNPTYFTVGNLVKYLTGLRTSGVETKDIVENYVFLTAGACGPCRFGTYVTEYRKALRDSGFEGFRVLQFQQTGGLNQSKGEAGLELNPRFFIAILKALVAGDILNALGYRIRPYEIEAGATDRALDDCKKLIGDALEHHTNILVALLRVRRTLSKIAVDRFRVKPKVAIIGEFWAMTTEGDGNYHLQRFLEKEGAEVDIQLVTAWILFNIWESHYDTNERLDLKAADGGRKGLAKVNAKKRLMLLKVADPVLRTVFQTCANIAGLHGYHLPDMHELADISHEFYDNNVRGGEAHMEVGKLILNVVHNKVNMTVSVKPFGCMPSSGVSDGVQSKITELYPEAIFCPIETTGDGAINVQSRVQMMLFKAKQLAKRECEETLKRFGVSEAELEKLSRPRIFGHALFYPPHRHGSTGADMAELVCSIRHPIRRILRPKQKIEFRSEVKRAPLPIVN